MRVPRSLLNLSIVRVGVFVGSYLVHINIRYSGFFVFYYHSAWCEAFNLEGVADDFCAFLAFCLEFFSEVGQSFREQVAENYVCIVEIVLEKIFHLNADLGFVDIFVELSE